MYTISELLGMKSYAPKNLAPVVVKTLEPGVNSAVISAEAAMYEKRVIVFDTEVTRESANCLQTLLLHLHSEGKEKITIHISSPGGDVVEGLAMLAILQWVKEQGVIVETFCRGMAASMASLLLMCGTKGHRSMLEDSTCLIHDLSSGHQGKFKDLEVNMDYTKELRKRLLNIVSKRTGKDIEWIKTNWFNGTDHMLFGDKALEEGVIDKVIRVDYGKC